MTKNELALISKYTPDALDEALDRAKALEALDKQHAEEEARLHQLVPILGESTAARWLVERRADIERERAALEAKEQAALKAAQRAEERERAEEYRRQSDEREAQLRKEGDAAAKVFWESARNLGDEWLAGQFKRSGFAHGRLHACVNVSMWL